MPSVADHNLRLPEIALPVSVKHPSRGFGMVARRFFFAPLGHFRAEDVEVAITVDVAELQAVPMDYLAASQIAALPVGGGFWVAGALVKQEASHAVARGDHDLRV